MSIENSWNIPEEVHNPTELTKENKNILHAVKGIWELKEDVFSKLEQNIQQKSQINFEIHVELKEQSIELVTSIQDWTPEQHEDCDNIFAQFLGKNPSYQAA